MALPQTIGRVPVEENILGLAVTTIPLDFNTAQPLLPDVIRFATKAGAVLATIASAGIKGMEDISKLMGVLPRLDPQSMGELLELLNKHSKTVLKSTVVVMPHPVSGELENFELAKADRSKLVFDERPDLFVPLCIFAGRVTFARFFPGNGQQGEGTPTPES